MNPFVVYDAFDTEGMTEVLRFNVDECNYLHAIAMYYYGPISYYAVWIHQQDHAWSR